MNIAQAAQVLCSLPNVELMDEIPKMVENNKDNVKRCDRQLHPS